MEEEKACICQCHACRDHGRSQIRTCKVSLGCPSRLTCPCGYDDFEWKEQSADKQDPIVVHVDGQPESLVQAINAHPHCILHLTKRQVRRLSVEACKQLRPYIVGDYGWLRVLPSDKDSAEVVFSVASHSKRDLMRELVNASKEELLQEALVYVNKTLLPECKSIVGKALADYTDNGALQRMINTNLCEGLASIAAKSVTEVFAALEKTKSNETPK